MQIVDTRPPQAKQENRIFRAIGCTAVYLTSAGALCSMAGLGRTLLGAWGAGTVLLLALCFLPEQAKIQSIVRLSLFLLLSAAMWVLWESARDGVCLFLIPLTAEARDHRRRTDVERLDHRHKQKLGLRGKSYSR